MKCIWSGVCLRSIFYLHLDFCGTLKFPPFAQEVQPLFTDLNIVLYLHNFWLSGKLCVMSWGRGFVYTLETSSLVSRRYFYHFSCRSTKWTNLLNFLPFSFYFSFVAFPPWVNMNIFVITPFFWTSDVSHQLFSCHKGPWQLHDVHLDICLKKLWCPRWLGGPKDGFSPKK